MPNADFEKQTEEMRALAGKHLQELLSDAYQETARTLLTRIAQRMVFYRIQDATVRGQFQQKLTFAEKVLVFNDLKDLQEQALSTASQSSLQRVFSQSSPTKEQTLLAEAGFFVSELMYSCYVFARSGIFDVVQTFVPRYLQATELRIPYPLPMGTQVQEWLDEDRNLSKIASQEHVRLDRAIAKVVANGIHSSKALRTLEQNLEATFWQSRARFYRDIDIATSSALLLVSGRLMEGLQESSERGLPWGPNLNAAFA